MSFFGDCDCVIIIIIIIITTSRQTLFHRKTLE